MKCRRAVLNTCLPHTRFAPVRHGGAAQESRRHAQGDGESGMLQGGVDGVLGARGPGRQDRGKEYCGAGVGGAGGLQAVLVGHRVEQELLLVQVKAPPA